MTQKEETKKCPKCGAEIVIYNDSYRRVRPGVIGLITVKECPKCGWWEWE